MCFRVYSLPWRGHPDRRLPRAVRLRLALEALGPIFIKFGQLLSTRRDFLDADLADELQTLQDQVPPFHSPTIHQLVESALDVPVQSVFARLETAPLASASVAQVHAATLRSGEEVVVKVVRPNIEDTIRADISLLKWLARLVEGNIAIGRRLRPVEVIEDYETVILGELDLMAEGANTTVLRRNFEHSERLYVPKVYWEYSRRGLLVVERIHGIPVADVPALVAAGVDLKKLAETGVEIFFTQVFDHSFFHADMHPGNIFVDPSRPAAPRYIAIDCAIIGSLSAEDQRYLAHNLLAIFRRDYRKVAQLHVASGWVPPDTPVTAFEAAMRTVCEPIFEKPLKDISFGHLLVELFRTAGRFNMEVQPSLVLLQKTLLNVEGLGRQLYPDLDLWQTALPFLENWQRRRTDPLQLLRRVRAQIPDWIHELPDFPQRLLDALANAAQPPRPQEPASPVQDEHRLRRRVRTTGVIALVLATAVAALPAPATLPAVVALAVVGIYLLATGA